MRTHSAWLSRVTIMVALGLACAGAAPAQTTTVETRNFEVISVDGNKLVVRDARGTQELTVPDDFRFTVDGKKMAVSELKPGMKGTAVVTTTTTTRPVVVTEVREGEVLRASDLSMSVREADGSVRRYTQGEMNAKGVEIVKDGKPVRMADLKRGDKLTATIITNGPPVVLTEQEVKATLAEADAGAASAPTPTQVAAAGQAAEPAAAPPAAVAPQPSAPPPASPPAAASGLGLVGYLVIAVLVALALFFFARRRKAP